MTWHISSHWDEWAQWLTGVLKSRLGVPSLIFVSAGDILLLMNVFLFLLNALNFDDTRKNIYIYIYLFFYRSYFWFQTSEKGLFPGFWAGNHCWLNPFKSLGQIKSKMGPSSLFSSLWKVKCCHTLVVAL